MECRRSRGTIFLAVVVLVAVFTALLPLSGCGGGSGDGKKETEGDKKEAGNDLAWPVHYRDHQRTGRSPYNGPGTQQVNWTIDAGAQSRNSWAVLDGGGNVVAGFNGKVISLNPDGATNWEFPVGGEATTCSVSEDKDIYFCAGNIAYALSESGDEKWSFDLESEADEPVVGPDGNIYVGSTGGKLVVLSPAGKLQWETSVQGNLRSPSFDAKGNLYCGASPLVMYSFDPEGEQRWVFKPEGELPLYEGLFSWANTIAMPSIGDDGTIYAGEFVSPGVTATGEFLQDYAIPQEGKILAVSQEGTKLWDFGYTGGMTCSSLKTPTIGRDGTLYAGTHCWKVLALTPDGQLKWEFDVGEVPNECPSVYSPSIGKDGLLYAATTNAKVFCITPDGTEKWRFEHGTPWLPDMQGSNNFTPPPIGEDGTIYSLLSEGKVFAFSPGGNQDR